MKKAVFNKRDYNKEVTLLKAKWPG